jgi:hypothetical protein
VGKSSSVKRAFNCASADGKQRPKRKQTLWVESNVAGSNVAGSHVGSYRDKPQFEANIGTEKKIKNGKRKQKEEQKV